jgi:hypothetical protein
MDRLLSLVSGDYFTALGEINTELYGIKLMGLRAFILGQPHCPYFSKQSFPERGAGVWLRLGALKRIKTLW